MKAANYSSALAASSNVLLEDSNSDMQEREGGCSSDDQVRAEEAQACAEKSLHEPFTGAWDSKE